MLVSEAQVGRERRSPSLWPRLLDGVSGPAVDIHSAVRCEPECDGDEREGGSE